MHRHSSVPTTLPRARAGSRLQPTPAAAPTDQLHRPVPRRLESHLGSSSVRVGSPPGSSHCGNGCACVLVRSVVPKALSNKLFLSRQQVFVGPLGLVCKCHGKGGGAGQRPQEGSLECRAATCPGFRKETTTRFAADAVSFPPRFLVQELIFAHRPYQCRPK